MTPHGYCGVTGTTPKSKVLARLTVTREDGSKVIVEVHSDATFHQFYQYFTQHGRRHSTKTRTRCGSRNDGLTSRNTHLQIPGLEIVALGFIHNKFGSRVVKTQIRFFAKKEYKKLINAAPDQLGLTKVRALFGEQKLPAPTWFSTKQVSKRNHNAIHAGATR